VCSFDTPKWKVREVVALIFGQKTGDCCQAPIHIRLVELGGLDASVLKTGTNRLKLREIASGQENQAWVLVGRTTVVERILEGRVPGLYGLLRDWDISAGYCVKKRFGNLGVHDVLSINGLRLQRGEVGAVHAAV
jgi:hypothetical protein